MSHPHQRAQWRESAAICFAATLLLASVSARSVSAQPPPTVIELAELPPPPDEIGELIRNLDVKMSVGAKPQPSEEPDSWLAAETRFEFAYSYRCRNNWTLDRARGQWLIRMRFSRIQWQPKHTIWFRKRPPTDEFWSDPLVLHEFDHVRISGDPQFGNRFEELLRERNTISHPAGASRRLTQTTVDQLVEEHVKMILSDVSELIAIRYQELDRVTMHGQRSIPSDSVLQDWLRRTPGDPGSSSDARTESDRR